MPEPARGGIAGTKCNCAVVCHSEDTVWVQNEIPTVGQAAHYYVQRLSLMGHMQRVYFLSHTERLRIPALENLISLSPPPRAIPRVAEAFKM